MKRISKTKEDFGWAKWDAETIKRVAREILDKKKGILDEIKKLSDSELNFENILYAFERSNDVMEPCNYFSILMNASPDESVRKAAEESTPPDIPTTTLFLLKRLFSSIFYIFLL